MSKKNYQFTSSSPRSWTRSQSLWKRILKKMLTPNCLKNSEPSPRILMEMHQCHSPNKHQCRCPGRNSQCGSRLNINHPLELCTRARLTPLVTHFLDSKTRWVNNRISRCLSTLNFNHLFKSPAHPFHVDRHSLLLFRLTLNT